MISVILLLTVAMSSAAIAAQERMQWRADYAMLFAQKLQDSSANGDIGATKLSNQKANATPAPPNQIASALHASSDDPKDSNTYFTVVGSFQTAQGAMRHLRDIRRNDLAADVAVYPPYYRLGSYWTVVAAAYSTAAEAEQQAAYARRVWLQNDAFVRRLPPRDSHPREYTVYLPSVAMVEYPNLISSPAPVSSPDSSHFVFVSESTNEEEANTQAAEIRRSLPGLNIAVFPPRGSGEPWRIALAAHATAEEARRALILARRLNLAEDPTQITLKAGEALAWRPSDRFLTAAAHEFRKRVESCFRDGSVTMGEMRSCAGAWVTPQALTACIGNSNTGEKDMPPLAEAEACAAIPDTVEGALLLARRGLSAQTPLSLEVSNYYKVTDTALTDCIVQAQGDSARVQQCMLPKLFSPEQKLAIDCMQKGSPDAIQACFLQAAVSQSGPGGQQAQETLKCMASTNGTLNGIMACLPPADKQALQTCSRCSNARHRRSLKRTSSAVFVNSTCELMPGQNASSTLVVIPSG